jgi:hypothetical protein
VGTSRKRPWTLPNVHLRHLVGAEYRGMYAMIQLFSHFHVGKNVSNKQG